MNNHDHGWYFVLTSFACWVAGHVTLSNLAFCVSIAVGLSQLFKNLRDIRRDKHDRHR